MVLGHHLWLHSALLTHQEAGPGLPLQAHSLPEAPTHRAALAPAGGRNNRSGELQVWAFLLFSQSAYCTNQVGFGKKADEVIKWVERCKHTENLKRFFNKYLISPQSAKSTFPCRRLR